MNERFRNLQKIEFTVTMACTGRCRHCSEGDHDGCSGHIDADVASEAIKKICARYDVKTVLAFGGEPLLYPDAVCGILGTASELGVPQRQLITNGFFSKDPEDVHTISFDPDGGVLNGNVYQTDILEIMENYRP